MNRTGNGFRNPARCARFHSQATGRRFIDTTSASNPITDRTETIRQAIKWTVYSLLLVNWAYYIFDDWRAAQFTVAAGDSLGEYLGAYATSLDEMAWFGMLFLFEAETYWLDAETMSRLQRRLFVALRFVCYAFLAHTVYAYIFNYYEISLASVVTAATSVCDLAAQDYSFIRNLAYTPIEAGNCIDLSTANTFFQIGGDRVVTDPSGLSELKLLYAVDIEDSIVWLTVVLVIEYVVYLQEKGVSEGALMSACNILTIALYGILICNALLWFWKGHWVYGWDELLWIGGFAAIEMNLSEWRDDLQDEAVSP